MRPTFEYCALSFWDQWHRYEARLYAAMSASPTEQDIRAALSYFQVARNFAGIAEDGIADHIRDCASSASEMIRHCRRHTRK